VYLSFYQQTNGETIMSYYKDYTVKCNSCGGYGKEPSYFDTAYGLIDNESAGAKCSSCAGTGKRVETYLVKDEKCSACYGTGKNLKTCGFCNGSGNTAFGLKSYIACSECNGSGKLAYRGECSSCHGTGKEHEYSGSKASEGCFITTAVCKILDYDDACHELTILRSFRDSFICHNHKNLLEEYSDISPYICNGLLHADDRKDIARGLLREYIHPAIDLIGSGKNEEALVKYREMVYWLKSRFGLPK
jgi:hypothetical protein